MSRLVPACQVLFDCSKPTTQQVSEWTDTYWPTFYPPVFEYPNIQGHQGVQDYLPYGSAEASEFMRLEVDEEFFVDPATRELENLDNLFAVSPEISKPMETKQPVFDLPEIGELVNIHDAQENPEPMDSHLEEPEEASDRSAPSPPPPSPCISEADSDVYLVERIIHAWGSKHNREYLIR